MGSNSLDQLKSPSSPRSIVLNAGYFIAFDRGFSVEPSFLVRTVEYAEILNYDLTLKSHHSFNRFTDGWEFLIAEDSILTGLKQLLGCFKNINNFPLWQDFK